MRIALMTNNYRPFMGGVPISVERLAGALRAQGHQVTVFAPTYRGEEEEEGVFRYKTCMNHFVGGIVLPNPFDRRIEREFQEQPFDIIHAQHPVLIGNTAVHLSRKYGIPLVFTYHTRYERYLDYYTGGFLPSEEMMTLYLRLFLRQCNFVFAPTKGIANYLNANCRVPEEKLGVLPTGLERKSYSVSAGEKKAIRDKFGAQGIPLLLTVSRMAREKNVEFLLKGIARTKELYHKPFKVLFVGEGPDRRALEERSARLGLSDICLFTGAVPNEEIAPYYSAADGFLFASKTETQGIVIAEAFAGRTPVVAVRASGVEDLVQDGVNGILTGEDAEEYALRLTDFLKDDEKRRRLAENAAVSGFSLSEESVALEAVHRYNEVIAAAERQNEGKKQHGKPVSYSCSGG